MNKKDFENITSSITNKLGEENTATIADDLAILMSDNAQVNELLDSKNKEINKLKKEKENLISTNGKLLQQVSMGIEEKDEPDPAPSSPASVNFNSFLDEKGNFKI